MKKNKQLRRANRRKKKIKKQTIKPPCDTTQDSFVVDDIRFTIFKDGRIRVATSEENLPEFLVKARKAIQAGEIEKARKLINTENIESVRQMIKDENTGLAAIYILAMTLVGIGRMAEAEEWYKEVLKHKPHWAVYNELANIMEKQQRKSEEMEYRKKALELNPDNGVALNNYGMHLVRIGQPEEGMVKLEKAIEKTLDNPVVHSNYVFFLHYLPDVDQQKLFNEHKEWARRQAPLKLARTKHDNDPDPHRKLRIGYVSADFRSHSVAYFIEILLDEQNHDEIESFAYSNVESPDHITRRLKFKLSHFRNIWGLSDQAVVDMIQKDKIDILVDLAGHTGFNRLPMMAYKPAPVQATYCGYPDTTGMQQIDYRLTDELADPPGSEKFHSEELVYLPDGFLSYRPPEFAPPVGPLPAQKNGYITFGSFNNNCKINSSILTIWAEVLKVNENSQFIIKFKGGDDQLIKEHYLNEFKNRGVEPDRIKMCGGLVALDHLNLYNSIDIALDTFPYNGTATTFEALWMGVPVISLVGNHHMSRVGLSILSRFGMEFLAAASPVEYLIRTTALASKIDELAQMRKIMRETIAGSCLCNTQKFVENVEAAYRGMWHKWCRTQGVKIEAASKTSRKKTEVAENKEELQKNQKPVIRVFHNMARSGGTLVSKCIGCMDNTILLSEIHPKGHKHFNPVKQAHKWHDLLHPVDLDLLSRKKNLKFSQAIKLIDRRSSEIGHKLVIRDWAHLDFIAVPFLEKAEYKMSLIDELKPHYDFKQIALVRHPVDQWLSLSKLGVMKDHLHLDHYLKGYLEFAQQAAEIGYIRYEDFTADPIWQTKILCEKLQLDFDQEFINKWYDYEKITGDTGKQSRGSKLRQIKSLPRPPVPSELLEQFRANEDYWKAIKILNYQDIEVNKKVVSHPSITIDQSIVYPRDLSWRSKKDGKINADRIFVSSMPRAGSMWTYNVTRSLIGAAGLKPLPEIVPTDTTPFVTRAFKEPPAEDQVHCVKTHFVVETPQNDENTLIIVPYRDIRDCIVSYMKFMHCNFEYALRAMKYWNPTNVYFDSKAENILKIRYNEVVDEPLNAIQKINSFIGTGVSFEQIENINEQFSRKKVKEKVDALTNTSVEQVEVNSAVLDSTPNMDGTRRIFDKNTGFQAGHITSQKSGSWRQALTETQQQQLLKETSDWLKKHGFDI
ncbi:MAG: O-linked N-acetylglucosamine transferase family protein [Planctomycetota bacterium]|jgi:predicted O-linked N-acetylglucosamine transferase (SPINDLY family)